LKKHLSLVRFLAQSGGNFAAFFDRRISRIAPEEHPEEQIQLTVRIRRK
jgi:hypothetical protein